MAAGPTGRAGGAGRRQGAHAADRGGADHGVIELNQEAFGRLRCRSELAIVPGATHLFEERGALEQVAHMAAAWFSAHLAHVEHPA